MLLPSLPPTASESLHLEEVERLRQQLLASSPLSPAATSGRGNLNDVQAAMEITATADAGSGVQESCCLCVGLPMDPGNVCLLLESGKMSAPHPNTITTTAYFF